MFKKHHITGLALFFAFIGLFALVNTYDKPSRWKEDLDSIWGYITAGDLKQKQAFAFGIVRFEEEDKGPLDVMATVCFITPKMEEEQCGIAYQPQYYPNRKDEQHLYNHIFIPSSPSDKIRLSSIHLTGSKKELFGIDEGGNEKEMLSYEFTGGMEFSLSREKQATYFGNVIFIFKKQGEDAPPALYIAIDRAPYKTLAQMNAMPNGIRILDKDYQTNLLSKKGLDYIGTRSLFEGQTIPSPDSDGQPDPQQSEHQ